MAAVYNSKKNQAKVCLLWLLTAFFCSAVTAVLVSKARQDMVGINMLLRAAVIFPFILYIAAHFFFSFGRIYYFLFRYRFAIAAILTAFYTILGIHGSSYALYKYLIGAKDSNSHMLFSYGQHIRSDEWGVFTPMMLSQTCGPAPLSRFSTLIRGSLTDTSMVYGLPSWSPITIYRPFFWGFLILGRRMGLAFFWNARFACLGLSSFELMRLVTGDRRDLSLAGAFLMTFAPAVSWCFAVNGLVEMLFFGNLLILAFDSWMGACSGRKRILLDFVMAWCAGGYLFTLYPAWMVPIAYLYLGLFIWVILNRRNEKTRTGRDRIALVTIMVLDLVLIGWILWNARDTISLVTGTVYPGKRQAIGSGLFHRIFFYPGNLLYPFDNNGIPINATETALVYSFYPLSLVLSCHVLFRKKRKDSLIMLLLAAEAIQLCWISWGMPELLQKITLLAFSPTPRTLVGFGFIDLVLLMRAISDLLADDLLRKEWSLQKNQAKQQNQPQQKNQKGDEIPAASSVKKGKVRDVENRKARDILTRLVLCGGLTAFVCLYCAYTFRRYETDYQYMTPIRLFWVSMVLTAGLALILFWDRIPRISLIGICVIAFLTGGRINPIQFGTSVIDQAPLSQKVQELSQEAGGENVRWMTVDGVSSVMGNYLVSQGASVINSTNVYPNLELWQSLDPDGKYQDVYNRYAHISVTVSNDPGEEDKFTLLAPDAFQVTLSNQELLQLGAGYVFSGDDLTVKSDAYGNYTEVMKAGDMTLYRLDAS